MQKTGRPAKSGLNTYKHGVLKGLGIGTGISIALVTTTLFAAAMKVFSAGEVISATELNRNFMISAPEGVVSAFYLSSCPEGWTAADGTNGAPDLRGRFIRGLNNFGTGTVTIDPDGGRSLGSEQLDAFQGHWHTLSSNVTASGDTVPVVSTGFTLSGELADGQVRQPISDGTNGEPRVTSETRPRNIGLIYCMRKN